MISRLLVAAAVGVLLLCVTTPCFAQGEGAPSYRAVRAVTPPVIDGLLDDAIWKEAPPDGRFFSTRSKPYGQPTTEPTVVQIAYDAVNLYVAFRCGYGKPGARDESFAGDEGTLIAESESVAVLVDAVHGHTGAYGFVVSPAGARADLEIGDQGATVNVDWRGLWDVATRRGPSSWTAELRIPWGTMRMPAHDGPFDVGIELRRREPTSGELSLWALQPPATEDFDTTFFGDLEGLSDVHPDQRLYLEPYLAVAFERHLPGSQSSLTDFTGTNGRMRIYGGAYARYQPPAPIRVDATFNPNFAAVNPDQAITNYDRFELEYPEARPFFAEDTPRFQLGAPRYPFGDLGAQLFYSRRLGITTSITGSTQAVPVLWGVKSVLRTGGTEAAVMNVELASTGRTLSLADNASVGRVTQTVEGQRFGAMVLERSGSSGTYLGGAGDGTVSLYDRHLQLSGFYAASSSAASPTSGAGEGTLSWRSQDVYAQATYLDIGKAFEAPLGFFPLTGARAELIGAGYTPLVRNDLVQQVSIDTQLSTVRDRDTEERIYDRGAVSASMTTIEQAAIQVAVMPAIETVAAAFPIGNGRITVPAGTYRVMITQVQMTTAPRRPVVFRVGYEGGDLYDGHRRAPSVAITLNLGRLAATTSYELALLSYGDARVTGHTVSVAASYAHSPLVKTVLAVEANTVLARALAQLVTTAQFGTLSTLSVALRGTGGSTLDTVADNLFDRPDLSAIASLAFGVSPF